MDGVGQRGEEEDTASQEEVAAGLDTRTHCTVHTVRSKHEGGRPAGSEYEVLAIALV